MCVTDVSRWYLRTFSNWKPNKNPLEFMDLQNCRMFKLHQNTNLRSCLAFCSYNNHRPSKYFERCTSLNHGISRRCFDAWLVNASPEKKTLDSLKALNPCEGGVHTGAPVDQSWTGRFLNSLRDVQREKKDRWFIHGIKYQYKVYLFSAFAGFLNHQNHGLYRHE